jgi:hypothetical protein
VGTRTLALPVVATDLHLQMSHQTVPLQMILIRTMRLVLLQTREMTEKSLRRKRARRVESIRSFPRFTRCFRLFLWHLEFQSQTLQELLALSLVPMKDLRLLDLMVDLLEHRLLQKVMRTTHFILEIPLVEEPH